MKKKTVSKAELEESLRCLYWTLHRQSKANSKPATLSWLDDKSSDDFDSTSCISGYDFEKFMPKARKLIKRLELEKGDKQ